MSTTFGVGTISLSEPSSLSLPKNFSVSGLCSQFYCEWLVVQSYLATQRDSIGRQVLASVKLSRCMVGDPSLDPSCGRSNKRMNCLSYLRLDFHHDRPPLPSLEGFPYCRNNLSQEFQCRATRSHTRIRSLMRFVSMLLSKA